MWEFIETGGYVWVILDREIDGKIDRQGCKNRKEVYYCYIAAREER